MIHLKRLLYGLVSLSVWMVVVVVCVTTGTLLAMLFEYVGLTTLSVLFFVCILLVAVYWVGLGAFPKGSEDE